MHNQGFVYVIQKLISRALERYKIVIFFLQLNDIFIII